jgi:hypothetical protein
MRSEGEMASERARKEHEVRLRLSPFFVLVHSLRKRTVRLPCPIVLVLSMIGFPCLNPRRSRRDARSLNCLVLVLIVVQRTPNYPRAYTPLTHLAYGGPFYNEISNFPGVIARSVLDFGRPRRPRGSNAFAFYPTDRPMVGVYYQTGQHGPQNGFTILLVEPGNDPELVESVVMDRHGPEGIAPKTREAAVFLRDGAGVDWVVDERVPGVGAEADAKEGTLPEPLRRWLRRLKDSGMLGSLVEVSSHSSSDSYPMAKRIRKDAFYTSNGEKNAPLSDKEFTERPTMFVVRQLQAEGTKGLLVLVVEGHSPEEIEQQVLAHLQQPAGEMSLLMAFGRGDEGVQVFT